MRPGAWIALGAVLVGGAARADTPPSVWDRARAPERADEYALHEAVHRRLVRTPIEEVNLAELSRALTMLQSAGAETSKNPLLRFDLAYVYLRLENYARAAPLYKAALAEFPDSPLAARAWSDLSSACGHLGDHDCESAAYAEVLRRETEDDDRANPTLNLAETWMHNGDLKESIALYEEALRLAGRLPESEIAPLAKWGLAVALDRFGDRARAEATAVEGMALERGLHMGATPAPNSLLRDASRVYFVPAYEIHWYEGLGATALARTAPTHRIAFKYWSLAVGSFEHYVAAGEPKKDRWLPIAKARLAQARIERAAAEKKAGAEKPLVVPEAGYLRL